MTKANSVADFSEKPLNLFQRNYLRAFIVSALICWSPFKALAYATPFLAILWLLVTTRDSQVLRRLVFWLCAWLSIIALHFGLETDFVLHSSFLSFLTYGTFAFLWIVPNEPLRHGLLYARMLRTCYWLVLIEAFWGIVQAGYGYLQEGTFDLGSGDHVEGTIHPQLEPALAFSNPMFAANMAFLLIALFPVGAFKKKWSATLLLGCTVLVLASVLHVLVFFVVSVLIALLMFRPTVTDVKTWLFPALGVILVLVLAFFLLPTNVSGLPGMAIAMVEGQYPRTDAIEIAFVEIPRDDPWMVLIGLGPGQFSSRAGLIGTGLYFGGPLDPRGLPLLPQGMSQTFEKYLLSLWLRAAQTPYYGSTQQPYFSWLSVSAEFGVPIFIGIFVGAAVLLIRVRAQAQTKEEKLLAVSWGAGLIFLFLLGMQENYWEVTQAIFVGAMLAKVQYALLISSRRSPKRVGINPHRNRKADGWR